MSIKKTHEVYLLEVAQKNPSVEVLGVYNGNKVKILHRCKICGHKWEVKPIHIIQGHKCPQCAKIQRATSHTMSHNDFVCRVNKIYPNIKIVGQYINTHHPIEVQCLICGHNWTPNASQLLIRGHGGTGCKQCYTKRQAKSTEIFQQELLQKNPNVQLVGDYINSYTKTTFRCNACEKQCLWDTRPMIILNGGKSPMCTSSNGVLKISKYLNDHHISYYREQIFEDCKNINCLPFDFYLPQYNMCIEYDGRQHFQPVNFNGCSDQKAMDSFQKIQINDNIKNQYCYAHNIKLIRISYIDENNINNILNTILFNMLEAGDAQW